MLNLIVDSLRKHRIEIVLGILFSFIASLTLNIIFSPILSFLLNVIFCLSLIVVNNRYAFGRDTALLKEIEKYKDLSSLKDVRISSLERDISKATAIDKIQKEKNQIEEELVRTTSFNHHLAGVISGLNHELSPLITGIYIVANRMQESDKDKKHVETLEKIKMAAIQTSEILSSLSKNVNKIKNFSVFRTNVKDTVSSWIKIVLLDRTIKDKISIENITIDLESLNFVADHSPMYLSQIILNLAKNSIDHNSHMLEDLKIKIHGDIKSKCLIYEDNGKGIPKEILSKVFKNFGVSTKAKDESGEIHGFGLYSCLNYCLSMRAIIVAESVQGKSTKFIIKFERIDENNELNPVIDTTFR